LLEGLFAQVHVSYGSLPPAVPFHSFCFLVVAGREKERKTWRSTRTHTLAEIDECRGGVGKKLKVETKSAQDRSKGGGAETQRLSGSLFRAFFFRTCHSFVLFCLIIFKNLVQVSNITTTIHTTGT